MGRLSYLDRRQLGCRCYPRRFRWIPPTKLPSLSSSRWCRSFLRRLRLSHRRIRRRHHSSRRPTRLRFEPMPFPRLMPTPAMPPSIYLSFWILRSNAVAHERTDPLLVPMRSIAIGKVIRLRQQTCRGLRSWSSSASDIARARQTQCEARRCGWIAEEGGDNFHRSPLGQAKGSHSGARRRALLSSGLSGLRFMQPPSQIKRHIILAPPGTCRWNCGFRAWPH